jgi:NADPH-dependent 2,4-dienoyl-CoA reductase/sulfur reductase-like enzyme
MAAGGKGLVIVGGGLASARAIKAYRENGGDQAVTLISADSVVPYHRPPLSKRYLRGEAEAVDTFVEPESFYREQDVDVRLEARATALRPDERTVLFEDGSAIAYDRLLVATGASPRQLETPGIELEGVHTLRTLYNSRDIREDARGARQAAVVGAGFIGMEVAASLSQLGLEVTLVHRGKGLFEILRARQVAQFLTELYGQRGVALVLGDEIAEFGGHTRLDSVTTKREHVIQAELAVVGIGVRPNTEWLDGSGLEIDNGVVVNERYETNVPDVYAVGDVARFYDPLFETHRRIEHWSNANYQGTQIGELLAGAGHRGFDIVSTFFTEVFGITFKVFGDVDRFEEIVIRGSLESENAIAFYLDDTRRLVACLLVGQDEETEDKLKELIAARATPRELEPLADEDSDLEGSFEAA